MPVIAQRCRYQGMRQLGRLATSSFDTIACPCHRCRSRLRLMAYWSDPKLLRLMPFCAERMRQARQLGRIAAAVAQAVARNQGFSPYTSSSPEMLAEPYTPPVLLPRVPTYTLPLAMTGMVNFTA